MERSKDFLGFGETVFTVSVDGLYVTFKIYDVDGNLCVVIDSDTLLDVMIFSCGEIFHNLGNHYVWIIVNMIKYNNPFRKKNDIFLK